MSIEAKTECEESKKTVSYDTSLAEPTITEREYQAFQAAYNFLNTELFAGSLPHVLVTFQRHANAKGYFAADRFEGRIDGAKAHELAMNPDVFTSRTDELILSTLAHEMAHVWQQTHGTPPRRAYHDRQWAAKMKEIGLQPSTTGELGGKETGQSVTHYIIPGGAYSRAYANLAANGFQLNWQSRAFSQERKKKAASKTKYTCPACGTNAWAKPNTALICGECYDHDEGDATTMEPEEVDTDD
ncbi:putative SprT family Zn-dependent metalloprotease [Granulicella aggregans]|uniref:Putative SprT family Zn-dependent metalloprotease n=1 Tax=Granulicella aggregans TaxID=474949 RepID=A0A7W7ZK40_9BACT|nr:SprT-like domain-containing protein [Granulicella aggregans]MBB5061198.1 putative SprT family Zn-dependent metalloprotease [Granulicella aggregans]